ncbi:MAG: prepilin-type N-terminal cleavage/methylation domain-containing protein [Pseudohongiellaceae bacterium]|jgi:prepilin-type N-terminal cleavage/methylation domain-containing protein
MQIHPNFQVASKSQAAVKIKAGARIKSSSGFTLLEVIVALTITGFILGGLLSLVAGSKRLAWTSEASLIRAARLRAATNFALLQNEFSDVELILENYDYEARAVELLEEPPRKTEASVFSLQSYEISNDERDERVTGSRWIQMELPK